VLDADLKGVLYTVALAVQHFRRQDVADYGFRGKIMGVSSVCGIYTVPTLPVYTAAKHGVVGLVRSYGKYLPEEKITLNAVCPNVVKTHISTEAFYDQPDVKRVLVPMEYLTDTFAGWLGKDTTSGQLVECGPKGTRVLEAPGFMDEESEELCGDRGLLYKRSHRLQTSKQ
jgi:NAD(P)-dependent dehydrogenase (short-subunit alcohol dehydrogenase family)